MKLRRREFMGLVGASVASISIPAFGYPSSPGDESYGLEKNGWRLQVTPGGEIVSFTDGKLELINQRLGGNRPRVVGGERGNTIASGRAWRVATDRSWCSSTIFRGSIIFQ